MDNDFYYSTVYSWFDKCGIISNVRTHLRQNLVKALKNKESFLKQTFNPPRSAKQYIYDLLIAEYLWNYNYSYTLSVFTSEAPLPVSLNQQMTNGAETELSTRGKLQADYVQHTLETLGIEPKEPMGQYIISEHINTEKPLLICLLSSLKSSVFTNLNHEKEHDKLVQKLQFKDIEIQTMLHGKEYCSKCKRVLVLEKKLFHQKETFDRQLKEKQSKLREQALATEQQVILLQEKMEQAQNLLHTLHVKKKHLDVEKKKHEEYIHQKELELLKKEHFLLQEVDRLEVKQGSCTQFEIDLKKLQEELVKIKKGLSDTEVTSKTNLKDIQIQTDFPNCTPDWNENSLLNKENQDLSSLVKEQQERIKQLTLRIVHLSRQLEEVQLPVLPSCQISAPKVRFSNVSTIFSESSSTEDILQDAKERLKRLEEESVKADLYYHNCILTSSL